MNIAKSYSFEALLHDVVLDRGRSIEAIRQGLPARVIPDMSVYFGVPLDRVCSNVGLTEMTSRARSNLDTAVSERIWRLADLVTMAHVVFVDETAAKNLAADAKPHF